MKRKANKAEKAHMARISSMGCLVCRHIGAGYAEAEIHHIGNGAMGMRSSHYEVIGLCHSHHRTGGHGIAIHAGKKTWEEMYGTEKELLELTLSLLDED